MSDILEITYENQVIINALLKGLTISGFLVDNLEFEKGGDDVFIIKTTNGKRIKFVINNHGNFIEI